MSTYLNGYRENAQDWTKQFVNSYADFVPGITGVNGYVTVAGGDVYVNFSGVPASPIVVTVPAPISYSTFSLTDYFGGAAGTNIILSGAPGTSWTFNGAKTYTINTAYGRKDVTLGSGVLSSGTGNWIVF